MNSYQPTEQDYLRSILLGILYTCISQCLKILIYQTCDKIYYTKFFVHFYWLSVTLMKVLTIMILSYPQIDEKLNPASSWNVTLGEVVVLGLSMTLSENILNVMLAYVQKSLLYNFYTGKEFENHKSTLESNKQRMNSSVAVIFKIKNELKQKEIYKKYYTTEDTLSSSFSSDEFASSSPKVGSVGGGFGGGFGGHIDLPNGSSLQGGFGGGVEFDSGHTKAHSSNNSVKSTSSSNKSTKRSAKDRSLSESTLTDILSKSTLQMMAMVQPSASESEEDLKRVLLNVIGILNVPEFVLNAEIPLITKKDMDTSNDFYHILLNSRVVSILALWWKLDNLIYNLIECFFISLYFLGYPYFTNMGFMSFLLLVVGGLTVLRCLKYEFWRYILITKKLGHERKLWKDLEFCNYGAMNCGAIEYQPSELVNGEEENFNGSQISIQDQCYLNKCKWSTYSNFMLDFVGLVLVLYFM